MHREQLCKHLQTNLNLHAFPHIFHFCHMFRYFENCFPPLAWCRRALSKLVRCSYNKMSMPCLARWRVGFWRGPNSRYRFTDIRLFQMHAYCSVTPSFSLHFCGYTIILVQFYTDALLQTKFGRTNFTEQMC